MLGMHSTRDAAAAPACSCQPGPCTAVSRPNPNALPRLEVRCAAGNTVQAVRQVKGVGDHLVRQGLVLLPGTNTNTNARQWGRGGGAWLWVAGGHAGWRRVGTQPVQAGCRQAGQPAAPRVRRRPPPPPPPPPPSWRLRPWARRAPRSSPCAPAPAPAAGVPSPVPAPSQPAAGVSRTRSRCSLRKASLSA